MWVNGSKPGYVHFIGGTQFAPGQWAGIVLDEPIGKNDGSVAGVRYFQCEDGRGIFTRPSKLSKTVLAEKDMNGTQGSLAPPAPPEASESAPAPTGNGNTTEAFSLNKVRHDGTWMFLFSPGQVSSIKTIAALNQISTESASNLSDPESQKKAKRELRLGDRVLVRRSLNARFFLSLVAIQSLISICGCLEGLKNSIVSSCCGSVSSTLSLNISQCSRPCLSFCRLVERRREWFGFWERQTLPRESGVE